MSLELEDIKRYAIVVAGGKGTRMQASCPKQFLPIGGRPILMYTLELFAEVDALVLVLPADDLERWESLCREHHFALPNISVCKGGDTRFGSVRNGLQSLVTSYGVSRAIVAIHDGVRPLVSRTVIETCYEMALEYGAALPSRPVVESLRYLQAPGDSIAVDRSLYVAVQTPQTFDLEALWSAYSQPYNPSFTDDASVWEAHYPHRPIYLVEGNAENLKITTRVDLLTAERLLLKE